MVWEGSRQGGWVGGIALGLYLSLALCAGMGEPRSLNLLPEPAATAFAVAHASAVFSGGTWVPVPHSWVLKNSLVAKDTGLTLWLGPGGAHYERNGSRIRKPSP